MLASNGSYYSHFFRTELLFYLWDEGYTSLHFHKRIIALEISVGEHFVKILYENKTKWKWNCEN